ncbi:MAG: glycosyl transferase, partial [Solirubrobacterales bacterium]|nr:glycosyl transferase [Solirubrobacterales bacterium]
ASPVDPTAARSARIARMRVERAADVADRPRQPAQPAGISPGEGLALRAIKQQLLQLTALRRQIAAESLARERPEQPTPRTVRVEVSRGWTAAAAPTVSVIVPVYNHADSVCLALDSLLRSTRRDWEVVVVDDGSTDGSGEAALAWIGAHPERRALLVRHEINRGLPHARNTGIAHARADLLLMLDSDNVLRRFAIARLAEALENDPDASFAYGILDRFSDDGPEGLLSFYDWEPERLREGNYIDALALIRRAALAAMGGYTGDPRLFGWEDYDLWARLAEAGHHGAFVPEIIARYRVGHGSMISLTNLSTTDAYAALADHAPQLMRGLQPPGISAGPRANGAAASRSATAR